MLTERFEVHEERHEVALDAGDPPVVLLGRQRPLAPGAVRETEGDVVGEAEVPDQER